jgi:hypothetical protein
MRKKSGSSKPNGISNERELTAAFRRYNNKHPLKISCAIEFKFVKGDRLNFKSHFRPQQLPCLYEAKHNCLYDKISDMSAGIKPFDAFNVCGQAFAAVMFSGDNNLYFLDIDAIYPIQSKSLKREEIAKKAQFFITL